MEKVFFWANLTLGLLISTMAKSQITIVLYPWATTERIQALTIPENSGTGASPLELVWQFYFQMMCFHEIQIPDQFTTIVFHVNSLGRAVVKAPEAKDAGLSIQGEIV